MTLAGLRAVEAAKQSGRWFQAYTYHKIGDIIPQDLIDALKTNTTAYQNFMTFPSSARIMYIHWINEAKRRDTRERRIHTVVARSTRNLRPGIKLGIVKKEGHT